MISKFKIAQNWSPRTKIILVGGLICVPVIYYFWSRRQASKQRNSGSDLLQKINLAKQEGIRHFRQKNYQKAIDVFKEAITLINATLAEVQQSTKKSDSDLKKDLFELLTNCYNNIAASYDCLNSPEECITYCTLAISLNPAYMKALNRRAKNLSKVKKYQDSLEDYLEIASHTSATDAEKLVAIQSDIDQVADQLTNESLEVLLKELVNKRKPIAQYTVAPWLWSTVTHDPLHAEMSGLELGGSYEGLSAALHMLKQGKYDQVYDSAVAVQDDESRPALERAKALLLSSRFAFYHNMHDTAKELLQRFPSLFEGLDEESKRNNVDLHIAYFTLSATISNLSTGELVLITEQALKISPTNCDPLMALGNRFLEEQKDALAAQLFGKVQKIDPVHPYAKYYDLYIQFLNCLSEQNIGRIHSVIANLEKAIDSAEKPPQFSLLLMTKIGMLLQNNSIAKQYTKKAIQAMPSCAYSLYLYGLLCDPEDMANPEQFADYLRRAEKIMKKVTELDPNYWEPYRMLAKFAVDREQFGEALDYYTKAIDLARNKEELQVLMKERLMAKVLEDRKRRGNPIKISSTMPK